MKCTKCKSEQVYYIRNSVHVECKCENCNSHIKFMSKVDIERAGIIPESIEWLKSAPLF
jgi:hypothetical protein